MPKSLIPNDIRLQAGNIVVFAHAIGADVSAVAHALDDCGMKLQRTGSDVAADVLSVLQPHSENGDGKGKKRSR